MMAVEPIASEIGRVLGDGYPSDLASVLKRMDDGGAFDQPSLFPQARDDQYARKLVWLDPQRRFMILGCTWAPGQVSALHDHGGFWGAELVVSGTMEETVYELIERDGGSRYRFERGASRISARGAVGTIAPPKEYHAFGNPGSEVAHTLHVYGGNLVRCNLFTHEHGSWWRPRAVDLGYDE